MLRELQPDLKYSIEYIVKNRLFYLIFSNKPQLKTGSTNASGGQSLNGVYPGGPYSITNDAFNASC